ncbi:MAG: MBL fold metallo-hydrolase [Anaerolineae bacterium]|nr:MBL fold metallo-hydrolase [Anaerolineae bacterium]
MRWLSPHVACVDDTCAVYVIRTDEGYVTVDFGAGRALDEAANLGQLTDVLMTHYHRDQGQGLPSAVAEHARVWVPETERALFDAVDSHWQRREVYLDYNMRQDRFSLLEPIPVAGVLRDYGVSTFHGQRVEVVPTPGHTTGSVSLLAAIDGRRIAFTGDLIAGPGQVWSLAATQWTYNSGEGLVATVLSLLDLKARRPDILLPSHGDPIIDVNTAIDLTVERLAELMRLRGQNPRLFQFHAEPYIQLTPHLLWNRTSIAYGYVLLSASGKALLFDFGYDFVPGPTIAAGSDRASRRPWLYTLPALKAQFGVTGIDAMVPTHFHDDHVAGANLLREVEGAQVWAAESFAPILERPANYNLPCLWFDPIPVDRVLPIGKPIRWQEYEFTLHPLPGHTHHAVGISLEVDGRRVLIAGDQYHGEGGRFLNYVYHNGFEPSDYRQSAALYRRLAPDLVLLGHTPPTPIQPDLFDYLEAQGEAVERLHAALLPEAAQGLGPDGFAATIQPYQVETGVDETVPLHVTVRNPHLTPATVDLHLATPADWLVAEELIHLDLAASATTTVLFHVTPTTPGVRQRVAVDVTVQGQPLGQQAEALITVRDR